MYYRNHIEAIVIRYSIVILKTKSFCVIFVENDIISSVDTRTVCIYIYIYPVHIIFFYRIQGILYFICR